MKICRRALPERLPIFTLAQAMFTNVGWEAQTTTRFGNMPKTTASRLFRRTPIFRNEACCVAPLPNSFGFARPTAPARKSRDSCGMPWQSWGDLSKKTRKPAWSLDRALRRNSRHLPAQLASYYRARSYDPQIGRFVSEDPHGLTAERNFYPSTANGLLNWVDLERLSFSPQAYGCFAASSSSSAQ